MSNKNNLYEFLDDRISFQSHIATLIRTIYFPLCGTDTQSLKSAITPFLSGDMKVNKFQYLTKPASREDLREDLRNVFVEVQGKGHVSLTQKVEEEASVVMGQLWHKLIKRFSAEGVEIEALNFIPVSGEKIEIMQIAIKNISKETLKMTPTFAVPLFCRSLSNKHDHEHVTALLNRIEKISHGIVVTPTMKFDEEGHKANDACYFVLGVADDKDSPEDIYSCRDDFLGDSGTLSEPEAVYSKKKTKRASEEKIQGKEALGALRFSQGELAQGESKKYIVIVGVCTEIDQIKKTFESFDTLEKVEGAFMKNKSYWKEKTHAIVFDSADADKNSWLQWVTLQPILRRIFGCSFLPDHDYGKGGKGWRDIWQDLLSLTLIEPEHIRDVLIHNFAGIRIDGSNATIIGAVPGSFIADRNAITRVWMDHGVWPFLTLLLYIHQTGDFDILLKKNSYFRDVQLSRTFKKDAAWEWPYGNKLKDKKGKVYQGTIFEHLLVQHLVQFFNVGEHNIIRLESADWNDGLDMAFSRGESVTFMSFYAGNCLALADLLEIFSDKTGIHLMEIAQEITVLLDTLFDKIDYDNVKEKKDLLFEKYFASVQPELSGEKQQIAMKDIVRDLRRKGQWIFEHIRKNEIVSTKCSGKEYRWFNGYYDNKGKRVEGKNNDIVQMTLTGQVFPVMSGLANENQIRDVVESARAFLKDKDLGGYRLNTDFQRDHYLDMGRAFGFAFGTKENGAFFSHMIVMYANALYKRGFVKEGYEVLQSIYHMCMDTQRSKIYPGIPEYFDSEGRGMYHYLTGAASWLVLTYLTEVYGIYGENGDLCLEPKLVKEEFKHDGTARVMSQFAGKKITVVYENKRFLDYGQYVIKTVTAQKKVDVDIEDGKKAKILRSDLNLLPETSEIRVILN